MSCAMLERPSSSASTSLQHSLTYILAQKMSLSSFHLSSLRIMHDATVNIRSAGHSCACAATPVANRLLSLLAVFFPHLPRLMWPTLFLMVKCSHILRTNSSMSKAAHSFPRRAFSSIISLHLEAVTSRSPRFSPSHCNIAGIG